MLSNSTQLNDRILWYDGDSTVKSKDLVGMLLSGVSTEGLCVDVITDEIRQFNQISEDKISVKTKVAPPNLNWNLPDEYRVMNLKEYLMDKLATEVENNSWNDTEVKVRIQRVTNELALFEKLNATVILRVLIYVINTLQDNRVPWGVGRGSSVSSYVLYLIGVHDVDSILYDLDITDFLHE